MGKMITETEMRAIEKFVMENELKEQAEKIQKILSRKDIIASYQETCGTCDLKFIPMYSCEGYGLCPDCDAEMIEKAKKAV